MKRILVEVICQSLSDCLAAAAGGADRIELVSGLYLGGLTPSVGVLRAAKAQVTLPIMAMLRPRGAGYCYDETEFQTMLADGEALLEAGADGLIFGCLTPEGLLDWDQNQQLCQLCARYGRQAVFHRAFDVIGRLDTVPQLIELGVTRILTSGFGPNAQAGIPGLQDLANQYGDAIEILAGASVSASNVRVIVDQTGVSQIHTSCRSWRVDPTTCINPEVPVTYDASHPDSYEVFDQVKLKEVLDALN